MTDKLGHLKKNCKFSPLFMNENSHLRGVVKNGSTGFSTGSTGFHNWLKTLEKSETGMWKTGRITAKCNVYNFPLFPAFSRFFPLFPVYISSRKYYFITWILKTMDTREKIEKAKEIEELGLSHREKLLVTHMVSGRTAKDAVKLAGYSEKSDSHYLTRKDKVRQGLMLTLESEGLGLPEITKRIKDGLDSTKIFGTYDDNISIPDYPTRFRYLELLCKIADVFPEQNQSVTVETMEQKLRRLHGNNV